MPIHITPYQADLKHSYSLGVFPTIELLENQLDSCLGVILHSRGGSNRGVGKIRQLCDIHQIPIQNNDKMVDRISKRGNTYAIGIFKKYQQPISRSSSHIVLVNPMGMGNLGTIMRAMLGFDHRDLVIIEPAADHYDPKVIRASMGAFFQLRVNLYPSFSDYWGTFSEHHLYPLMTDGQQALSQVRLERPYAFVFGNESSGLPDSFHQYGDSLYIPQNHNIDSLNLALSVGIALYHSTTSEP